MLTIIETARRAHAAGICVIPAAADGTKRPMPNPSGAWKEYQTRLSTLAEIEGWFGNGHAGIGFVTGAISGNLELLEFEGRAVDDGMLEQFDEAARAAGCFELLERLNGGYVEWSPSGGLHLLYRCDEPLGKSEKLAWRAATPEELVDKPHELFKLLIETKSSDGFVVVAPSNGTTHPNGGAWAMSTGSIETIPAITAAERRQLHDLARLFDQTPRKAEGDNFKTADGSDNWTVRPGDAYAESKSWADILEPADWRRLYTTKSGNEAWQRPGKLDKNGKPTKAISATISDYGTGCFYCFTTSTEFEANRGYSKFSAYVLLEHGGDVGAAVADLIAKGYGKKVDVDDLLDDEEQPATSPPHPSAPRRAWPVLDEAALLGLAGDVVRAILPHTEADGAALLVDFLVSYGSAVGLGPHALADGSEHPPRLNAVLVGETSRARKGTSRSQIKRLFEVADAGWSQHRVMGGLASGEGLIAAVHDGDPDDELDMGVVDKRLLVVEPEFARLLTVAGRDSNTLSAIVREAFDSGTLRVMTRKEPLVATGAGISVLGHITLEELRKRLSESESANGFANRFLYVAVKRSKLLPSGGNLDPAVLAELGERTRVSLMAAARVKRMRRTPEAEAQWARLYAEMAEGPDGLLGSLTARSEALVLRLSVVYALLDEQPEHIGVEHLTAAWALWRYCAESAAFIFGDATGDEVADKLLAAVRSAGSRGLDSTEQSAIFGRHVSAERLRGVRQALEDKGLVYTVAEASTGGRPRQVTCART